MSEPHEEARWLWEGMMPWGGLSVLAAKPKVGKSTFARNLALAVSRGEPFLGRATHQGPVVYLGLEEKRSEVESHLRALGADGSEVIHIHVGMAPRDALIALRAAIMHT
ncbi:MAG: AAA family ATPase [SAR202 cluster bacterium]|nr:AAA family ATPase [SAR202 cluster bacterium]